MIALKAQLARRVLHSDPEMARREIADVEQVTRTALQEVRDAVSGYRQPTLADELAGARTALDAAGIACTVEHATAALPPSREAVLAWGVREATTNVIRTAALSTARSAWRSADEARRGHRRRTGAGRGGLRRHRAARPDRAAQAAAG